MSDCCRILSDNKIVKFSCPVNERFVVGITVRGVVVPGGCTEFEVHPAMRTTPARRLATNR